MEEDVWKFKGCICAVLMQDPEIYMVKLTSVKVKNQIKWEK